MSFKPLLMLLAALAGVLSAESAWAAHCGAVKTHAAPDPCCFPKIRYKTCYQTVVEERPKVTYQTVKRTEMKECRQIVCRPVWEEHEEVRKYVVCKPIYEHKVREHREIVCRTVWEEYQVPVKYYTSRPVYEHHTRTICETRYRTVEEIHYRDCVRTTCRPVTTLVNVCKTVYDTKLVPYQVPGKCYTKMIPIPGGCTTDPCTGATCYKHPTCQMVTCQMPPETRYRTVCVPRIVTEQRPVTHWVRDCHVEKVPYKVCKRIPYTVTREVPYTTCRWVTEEHTKMVPCRRPRLVHEEVVRQVPYVECRIEKEEKQEIVKVRRCRMVKEEIVKLVPVTICEKVPVCTMEKVCRRVKVKVPVCECAKPGLFDHLRGLLHKDDCCK